MRLLFISIALLLITPRFIAAQDSIRSNDVYRFVDATLYTFSQPIRWKGKDWAKFGGLAAGTALISLIDEPVNNFWKTQDNKVLDGIEFVGFHYGKPYSATFFTSAFYLTGLVFKSEKSRDIGMRMGVVLLTAGAIQTASKTIFGRARPGTEVGAYKFKFFSPLPDYHSFPSGHASVAIAISLTVASNSESQFVKVLFYSLAGSTVIARMYSNAHWVSDLVYGGTLAWVCNNVSNFRMDNNKYRIQKAKRKDAPTLSMLPYPGGMSLSLKFN